MSIANILRSTSERIAKAAGLMAVLAIPSITSAHGTLPYSDPNVIHGCRDSNGKLRQILSGACNNSEAIVHWAIVGPPGPIGPTGATGEPGPQGIQGIQGVQGEAAPSMAGTAFRAGHSDNSPTVYFLPTTYTVLTFPETFDDGSNFDGTYYTVPADGVYHFDLHLTLDISPLYGGYAEVSVNVKNGPDDYVNFDDPIETTLRHSISDASIPLATTPAMLSSVARLEQGDQVYVSVQTGLHNVFLRRSSFSIHRVY